VRHAPQLREHGADEAAFLVGVDRIVPAGERAPDRGQRQQRVERNLRERRPDLHVPYERRPQAAEDAQPRHRHGLAERIGHEVDLVAERGERADAMELAERRAARLEERLGRDHQDAHGWGGFLTDATE
jgi:hypothetical protein